MKYLALLVSIICSVNCFSQNPNPDLFQTWYLRYVQSNDLATPYNVFAITPSITPTLTIFNTLNYTGTGACNTFNGSFTNVTVSSWQHGSFSDSGIVCSTQNHNYFEDGYFGFLQTQIGYYQIYSEGSGQVLRMDNPIFGSAIFQNYALGTADFEIERVILYPNPSHSVLYLNGSQLLISKIQILNSLGQNVKTLKDSFEVIDIADLASGIYLLKMESDFGTISKKFIKE